jgi:phosphoribosylformylglycinamidine synthase
MGQVADVRQCVTMDLKEPGNLLLLVGTTLDELGGSHWAMVRGLEGGRVPRVRPDEAPPIFRAVHRAITRGLVRSCHDLSEGGLAVALAEMAIAGGLGVEAGLGGVSCPTVVTGATSLLFSESPTRFILEVRPEALAGVLGLFDGLAIGRIGAVTEAPRLVVHDGHPTLIDVTLSALKDAWQAPLRW